MKHKKKMSITIAHPGNANEKHSEILLSTRTPEVRNSESAARGQGLGERNSQQACNSAAGLKASGPFRTTLNKRLLYSERLQRQIPTHEK